jgi:hypothetical protein
MKRGPTCGRGEMVDTQGLGPCGRKAVGVQVPSPAPFIKKCYDPNRKTTRWNN